MECDDRAVAVTEKMHRRIYGLLEESDRLP